MSDDFDREEQAFADALRGALEGEEFRPLDPRRVADRARHQPRVGRPWLKGLAAAASVVLVVGAAATMLPHMVGGSASSGSQVAAEPSAGGAASEAVGGADATAGASAAFEWSTTAASPLSPRTRATATWLDGRYYVIGGLNGAHCAAGRRCPAPDELRDGAAYSPDVDAWQPITDAPVALADSDGTDDVGADVVAAGGKLYVLLVGDGTFLSYDPASDAWTTLASGARRGRLVAAGERVVEVARVRTGSEAVDRLYDPATAAWSLLPADPLGAGNAREAAVADGQLVLSVGSRAEAGDQLAELDLGTLTWRTLPRHGLGTKPASVGDVVVWPWTGSRGGSYTPATGAWAELPALPKGASVGGEFQGVVAAGRVGLGDALFDPATGEWTTVPDLTTGAISGRSIAGGPDGLFVFGGWTGTKYTASAAFLPLG